MSVIVSFSTDLQLLPWDERHRFILNRLAATPLSMRVIVAPRVTSARASALAAEVEQLSARGTISCVIESVFVLRALAAVV